MRTYETIETRDRERTCWEMLRWFEGQRYVQEQLIERYCRQVPDPSEKATEIAACVVQAREYFEAARRVSLATQPTLLYYGMASFASAIALSADPRLRHSSLGKDHGVTLDERQQAPDLDGLALKVKERKQIEGTLPDLLRAVQFEHYSMRYDESQPRTMVVRAARDVTLARGQSIPLGELLATIPELAELAVERYRCWPTVPPRLESVQLQEPGRGAGFRIIVRPGVDSGLAARDWLQQVACWDEKGELGTSRAAEMIGPAVADPNDLPLSRIFRSFVGRWYLYNRSPYLLMPTVAAFVAIGFCFGFLARYRPTMWAKLTAGNESHAVQVIRRFYYLVFEEFPVLALRELMNAHVSLGPTFAQMGG